MQVFSRSPRRFAVALRHVFTVVLASVCLVWVVRSAGEVDFAAVQTVMADITGWQWGVSLLATGLSFAALARYDVLFHRWLDTPVSTARAARSGAASIALAQTLGFGLVTGTFARWRALPELSLGRAAQVTQYVSFSFMVALGVLCALLLPLTPIMQVGALALFSGGTVVLALFAAVFSLRRPAFLPFHLPPLGVMARLCVWMVVDVLCATVAFYLLLPPDNAIAFAPVFAAFVIALSAGLLSGSPGGVGPFELSLLALLPAVPMDDLLAAVLAFRLIYYALPAALGMLCLFRPTEGPECKQNKVEEPVARAETHGLSAQDGHALRRFGFGQYHVAETSQCLVLIGGPTNGKAMGDGDLAAFRRSAQKRGLTPALYKAPATTAAQARRAGWSVLQVSEEAYLTPAAFSLEGRARRQLRRKLKRAEAAGLNVRSGGHLPLAEMEALSARWASRCGGERGFSMARFDKVAVRRQPCFLAYRGSQLVAFATFHATPDEWCLDLMRQDEDASDGAMHALIVAAIQQAAQEGVTRLSLAAMPPANPTWAVRQLTKGSGLRQFKLSFAPKRQPLYLIAPNLLQLGLAGLDIVLRIRFPDSPRGIATPPALQKLQSRLSDLTIVKKAARTQFPIELETSQPTR